MRKLLLIVALAATFVTGGNVFAQNMFQGSTNVWYTWAGGANVTGAVDLDNFGMAASSGQFRFGAASQTIDNFWFTASGSTANANGLTIGTFWVTPESLNGLDGKLTGSANITNVKMSVGAATTVPNDTKWGAAGSFGGTTTANNVALTGTSINGKSVSWAKPATQYGIEVGAGASLTGDTTMTGGFINNAGTIDRLTYGGGTVNGTDGAITSLVADTNVSGTGNNWGAVDSLSFKEGGNGLMTITGSYDAATGLEFGGLDFAVNSVDLTNGKINVDFTGVASAAGTFATFQDWVSSLTEDFSLDIGNLFGNAEVDGSVAADDVSFLWAYEGTESTVSYTELAAASGLNGTWSLDGNVATFGAAVPEPATLAVLGLGLAGLGMVSRRRKK